MKKRIVFMIMFFGLMGAVGLAEIADGWILEQISDSGYIEAYTNPRTSEGYIAWLEYRQGNGQIFFWDGQEVIQISSGLGDCGEPQISGSHVVWREWLDGQPVIILFDGVNTSQLSNGSHISDSPQVSGSKAVWIEIVGNIRTVYLWNGGISQPLSSGSECYQPVIDGDRVAWAQNTVGGRTIRLWDPNGVTDVTETSDYISELGISGNQLIWVEGALDIPSEGKIFFWDGDSVEQLSGDNYNCRQPRLSEGHAAWIENNQVMYWDGSTVSSLTANSKDKIDLAVSQARVIWNEKPELVPVFLLYLWDGSETVRFTDMPGCSGPAIWQDQIVWLAYDDDYDMQVFSAQPGTVPAAIPGDINQDQSVNILDFSILADNWLKNSRSGG